MITNVVPFSDSSGPSMTLSSPGKSLMVDSISQNITICRIKEILVLLDPKQMESFVTSLWEGFADELRDLRESAGMDWAIEGGKYLYTVIRILGQRMMETAFLNKEVQKTVGENVPMNLEE